MSLLVLVVNRGTRRGHRDGAAATRAAEELDQPLLLPQLVQHPLEGFGQLADLVVGLDIEAALVTPLGHLTGHVHQLAQGLVIWRARISEMISAMPSAAKNGVNDRALQHGEGRQLRLARAQAGVFSHRDSRKRSGAVLPPPSRSFPRPSPRAGLGTLSGAIRLGGTLAQRLVERAGGKS